MECTRSLSTYGVLREVLAWELIRCRRYRRLISVLLIDLDHLAVADSATAASQVAESIGLVRQHVREVDLVGSRSQNGLIVLLPETGKQGAMVVAERLHQILKAQLQAVPDWPEAPPVALTIGASGYLEDADSAEGLLGAAQRALAEERMKRVNHRAFGGVRMGRSCNPPQLGSLPH